MPRIVCNDAGAGRHAPCLDFRAAFGQGGWLRTGKACRIPQPIKQSNTVPEWHDYYYHNLGDALTLNGETEPTEEIAFVESGLYALSYIKDKKARKGRGDLVATFDWERPEGLVRTRLFMNDADGRTFISAYAPATEGLSRVKSPNYGITRDSRTPCLVVRQRGAAWNSPFVAVIDPSGTVSHVKFGRGVVRVTRSSGKTDDISFAGDVIPAQGD